MPSSPFGIQMGSAVSALTVVQELPERKYIVTSPKPHPQFETYAVQASATHGIAWIKGIGAGITNDAYGYSVKALIEKLQAQLEGRYGPGIMSDTLFSGSIWSEPRDWSMGLHQGERTCFCIWERPQAHGLPDDLESVFLGAGCVDGTTTNLFIEYASTSHAAAEQEIDDASADLL